MPVAAVSSAAAAEVSASELATSQHAAASSCHASPANQTTRHDLLQQTLDTQIPTAAGTRHCPSDTYKKRINDLKAHIHKDLFSVPPAFFPGLNPG